MFRGKLNISIECRSRHTLLSYIRPASYIYVTYIAPLGVYHYKLWKYSARRGILKANSVLPNHRYCSLPILQCYFWHSMHYHGIPARVNNPHSTNPRMVTSSLTNGEIHKEIDFRMDVFFRQNVSHAGSKCQS